SFTLHSSILACRHSWCCTRVSRTAFRSVPTRSTCIRAWGRGWIGICLREAVSISANQRSAKATVVGAHGDAPYFFFVKRPLTDDSQLLHVIIQLARLKEFVFLPGRDGRQRRRDFPHRNGVVRVQIIVTGD